MLQGGVLHLTRTKSDLLGFAVSVQRSKGQILNEKRAYPRFLLHNTIHFKLSKKNLEQKHEFFVSLLGLLQQMID